ncbi:chitinase-3-like protein 1 [Anopheles maculipalpis]|uniref:chitinase-3-like protein 1 n=1 Tax=Anopheles maculipalpis TaxID=1496333 RepID=UPI002158B8A9|nr:chitinase-3-like protein 1 [Anopheles maculipalpis]
MVHFISLWSVALVAVCSLMVAVESKEVVCYYGTWATYRQGNGKFATENIDPFLCTQLNYAFFDINPDGSIRIPDEYLALPSGLNAIGKFYELKQRNPALKTVAAIGGWNAGTANFRTVAANPQLRATFARNAVSFLQQYRFDGMDIDWEYPTAADKSNFVLFLRELASSFAPYNYLLTVAVAAPEATANEAYDIPAISSIVSYINLMTYDMHGNYGVTRHQAPVNQGPASIDDSDYKRQLNVEAVVKYWLSRGAAASKLTLGIPLYGRTFKLSNPSVDGVGAPTSGVGTPGPYTQEAGSLGYNEICESSWPRKLFDSVQIAAYASGNGQWVSYDSVDVVNQKCNVIAKYGLGGGMVWSIEQDDFRGVCGPKFTLLSTLNRCVNNNGPPSASTSTTQTLLVSSSTKRVASTTTTTKHTTTAAPITTTIAATPGSGSFVCPRDGYFRDPSNCNKYYRCYSGYKYEFNCPSGLYFNEEKLTCDWPYNVKC